MSEATLTLTYNTAKEAVRRYLGFSARKMVRQACTVVSATDVFTATAHGFVNGEVVQFSSSTTLPAGLSADTNYFIVTSATNTFSVAAVPGGTAVDVTDTGTGTHYVYAEDLVTVEQIMNSGASMFYTAHNWNFMDCWTTLATGVNYTCTATAATDVIACSGHPYSDGNVVHFTTTTTLPSPLAVGTDYYIRDTVAATSFKVALTSGGTAVDITTAGTGTHTVRIYGFQYDLPDNFGRLKGNIRFAASEANGEIQNTSVERVLQSRVWSNQSGHPTICAVRPKAVAQTTGQRFEVIFYPSPDSAYTLTYCYRINPESWDHSTRTYPLGGAVHRECLLEAMLSRAEVYRADELGLHFQEYNRLLEVSKGRDAELAPDNIGYNGDNGGGSLGNWPVASTSSTTYYNS